MRFRRERITVDELKEILIPEVLLFSGMNHAYKEIISSTLPKPDPIEQIQTHWDSPQVGDHFYVIGTESGVYVVKETTHDGIIYSDEDGQTCLLDYHNALPLLTVSQMIEILDFTSNFQIQNTPHRFINVFSHYNTFSVSENDIDITIRSYPFPLSNEEIRWEQYVIMLWEATKFVLHEGY